MNSEEAQAKITRTLRSNGFQMRGDIWELEASGRVTETRNAERAVIVEMDLPEGLKLSLDRFCKNPVVLYEHHYDRLPIGRSQWERLRVQEGRDSYALIAKVKFHLDTDTSRMVWDRVFAGELRRFAPGVIPTAILETDGCARVMSGDLIEYSIMEAPEDATPPKESPRPSVQLLAEKDKRIAELEESIADLKNLLAGVKWTLADSNGFIERRLKELDL